jgi:hypothetical protein
MSNVASACGGVQMLCVHHRSISLAAYSELIHNFVYWQDIQ